MIEKEDDLVSRLGKLNSSIVHDALRTEGRLNQTLPPRIKPICSNQKLFGIIWTLQGKIENKIDVHDSLLSWTNFLSKAKSDSVIVCQPNNDIIALMGELSAETLFKKKVRGYIVDGGSRDIARIKEIGFPVFCKFYSPKDIAGRWKVTELGAKIKINDIEINTGDYVIADEDGIVIIPKNDAKKIILKAEQDFNTENKMRKAILSGEDPQKAYLKYGKF